MARRTSGGAGWWILPGLVFLVGAAQAVPAAAQTTAARGSRNVALVSHLAVEGGTGDVEIEQEPARPYVYLAQPGGPGGFAVVDVTDPAQARILYQWQIDDAGAHGTGGARDLVYAKIDGRYYLIQTFQFDAAGPHVDLGAVVFDVTGLPDPSTVREAARLHGPRGGFHHVFAYKHSDGRALLFATGGGAVHVYDLARLLDGDPEQGLTARLDTPEQLQAASTGYHAVFAGFDAETQQDRLYGAGAGGYYVYDVTAPSAPALLTSISSAAVQRGHAISPTPDGRYVVTAAGYRTAPLRIFDLRPGLDGTVPRIRTALGAWTADWRHAAENYEVRWPYVFVAAGEDGLHVFNMRDPVNPYTVAFYHTYDGPPGTMATTAALGAWDVDVRNADGLIVVSDRATGFWAFRLEAFTGWHGPGWGLPHMSSAQDWDDGPAGK